MNTFIRSDDRPDGHKGRPCKGIINAHPTYRQRTCRPCKGSLNGSIVPKESAVFILLRSGKSHHTTDNLYAMESAFKFFHALQQFVKRKRITINHRELHCLIIFLPYVKTFFRWS